MQYSTYGRTSCVLLMVALRCISKAAIPAAKGDLDRLRLSASVHFAVAAAILLACVLVVAFAIPALAQQVAEKEHPTVPGGEWRLAHPGRTCIFSSCIPAAAECGIAVHASMSPVSTLVCCGKRQRNASRAVPTGFDCCFKKQLSQCTGVLPAHPINILVMCACVLCRFELPADHR